MMKEATRLIRSESISSLLLYLQEMDVDRVRDDVKAGMVGPGPGKKV